MHASDFDFDLPLDLIAQHPAPERSGSRLLEVCPGPDAGAPVFHDRSFKDISDLLHPGDLLILNNTRVIKARLLGCKQGSGGRIEVLIERPLDPHHVLCQLRASKTPRPGTRLMFWHAGPPTPPAAGEAARADVLGREGEFFRLRFAEPIDRVLERCGHTPLPPYIDHAAAAVDDERYQTVYAREAGAVAAPTAGLHFDEAVLTALAARGVERAVVTLHVGAGTFAPLRSDDLSRHVMHEERFEIPAATVEAIRRTRAAGGRIIAVGTTTLRALEAAAASAAAAGATDDLPAIGADNTRIFITPGFSFRVVERLITNFHLPRSTLMMLVSAFGGPATLRAAYAHAIAARYRFFSYGDAMLLSREDLSPCPASN